MRLTSFIFIILAMLVPFVSSISVALPFFFADRVYFAAFASLGLTFALLSRLPVFGVKPHKIVSRNSGKGITKLGFLSAAVVFWAVIAISYGDYWPLSLVAFYFALVLAVRHEEEWLRLSRFFLWLGALSAWVAVVGQKAMPLLKMHLPLAAPVFFIALIFWVRSKASRLERWGYALISLWLANVLTAALLWGFDVSAQAASLKMLWSGSRSPAWLSFTALWIAVFAGLFLMKVRKRATWPWALGLTAAFTALLLVDPLLSGGVGSGAAFFFLAALVEWVNNNEM
jgi:hypothetical protein